MNFNVLLSHLHPSFSAVGVSFSFVLIKWRCVEKLVGKNIQEYEKLGKGLLIFFL